MVVSYETEQILNIQNRNAVKTRQNIFFVSVRHKNTRFRLETGCFSNFFVFFLFAFYGSAPYLLLMASKKHAALPFIHRFSMALGMLKSYSAELPPPQPAQILIHACKFSSSYPETHAPIVQLRCLRHDDERSETTPPYVEGYVLIYPADRFSAPIP